MNEELKKVAKALKLLILDVDGVLTDGTIILDNEGNELKVFNVKDGHGLKMLSRIGVKIAIITGRYSKAVEKRAKELGITEVYQRCYVKTSAYEHLIKKLEITDKEVAYIGDDVVDIPLMKRVALPIAVADGADEAKSVALFVTKSGGGKGAVREVCELIIKAKDKWEELINEYLES